MNIPVRALLSRFLGAAQVLAGQAVPSFSQEGEDRLLGRMLETKRLGFYVDVGAHHPIRFSNTYMFYLRGWRGINIDAMPGSMRPFRYLRPRDINIECGVARSESTLAYHVFKEGALNTFDQTIAESYRTHGLERLRIENVRCRPLADLLADHCDQPIDFMSIDVEGLEMAVFESNDWKRFRPRVCVFENLDHKTPLPETAAHHFLARQDYEFAAKTFNSVFYIDKHA